jgi:hypothetical protein
MTIILVPVNNKQEQASVIATLTELGYNIKLSAKRNAIQTMDISLDLKDCIGWFTPADNRKHIYETSRNNILPVIFNLK